MRGLNYVVCERAQSVTVDAFLRASYCASIMPSVRWLVGAVLLLSSCRRTAPPAPSVETAASVIGVDGVEAVQAVEGVEGIEGAARSDASPGRCRAVGKATWVGEPVLADAGAEGEGLAPFGAELGTIAVGERAFLVGAREPGMRGARRVLCVPFEGTATSVLASWDGVFEARAPLLAVQGSSMGAALLRSEGRALSVALELSQGAVPPSGPTTESPCAYRPLAPAMPTFAQSKDESEATALMLLSPEHGLLAWDDVEPAGSRGIIRVMHVPASAPGAAAMPSSSALVPAAMARDAAVASDILSPSTSDASDPQLVRAADGSALALLWLAERAEDEDADGGGGEPGRAAAFRWVEGRLLDPMTGQPRSEVHTMTATTGHAQTFTAAFVGGELVVLVRDDARPTDGDGGVLRLTRRGHNGLGPDTHTVTVVDGDVEPGVPLLLVAPKGGLRVVHHSLSATVRLLPVPSVPPSAGAARTPTPEEPLLAGRRVLASAGNRLLASRLACRSLELSLVDCP